MSITSNNFEFEIPFAFRKGGAGNLYGIWLRAFGQDFLLNPPDLFSSLLENDGTMFVKMEKNTNGYTNIHYCFSNGFECFILDRDQTVWTLTNYILGECKTLQFAKDKYVLRIKDSIYALHEHLANGGDVAHENINCENVSYLLEKFDVVHYVSTNSYKRFLKAMPQVDELSFECKHDICDLEYKLTVGNFVHESYISDWTQCLSELRRQLEDGKKIELYFEDDPTTITITNLSILEGTQEVGTGTCFNWARGYVLLKITPNEFSKDMPYIGICKRQQVLKAIYEGLLNTQQWSDVPNGNEYDYNNTWDDISYLTFYNQIKSPLVENKIQGWRYSNGEVERRQVHIKHILTITPDVDFIITDEEGICHDFWDTDELKICFVDSSEETSIKIDGFQSWLREYQNCTDFTTTETDPSFDYEAWHRRGIELAQKLRDQLPDEIDLWYAYPFEDEERRSMPEILVYKKYECLKCR